MRLVFTLRAEEDLEAIGDYIAIENPKRAFDFIRELRKQCQRIAQNPLAYRLRSELAEDLRSCAYGHYVIFFEAGSKEIAIVRVLHGARDLPAALDDDTH
ncbi:MAG: type II toxin-antitoxin system RelE/ParE family toxin [Betaproteobacteria bacterium]|nr:type II toxin-antitoxin system RelE/ParE family toxin [Betaproteobacteria bacterium]